MLILRSSNLSFRVGSDPRQRSIPTQLGHLGVELVSQDDGERHALLRLIRGITKHETLSDMQS